MTTTMLLDQANTNAPTGTRWIASSVKGAMVRYQLLDGHDQVIAFLNGHLTARYDSNMRPAGLVDVWTAYVMRNGQQINVAAGVALANAFRAANKGAATGTMQVGED